MSRPQYGAEYILVLSWFISFKILTFNRSFAKRLQRLRGVILQNQLQNVDVYQPLHLNLFVKPEFLQV